MNIALKRLEIEGQNTRVASLPSRPPVFLQPLGQDPRCTLEWLQRQVRKGSCHPEARWPEREAGRLRGRPQCGFHDQHPCQAETQRLHGAPVSPTSLCQSACLCAGCHGTLEKTGSFLQGQKKAFEGAL